MGFIRKGIFFILFYSFFVFIAVQILVLKLFFFKYLIKGIHKVFNLKNKVLYLPALHGGGAGYKYRVEKWMTVLNEEDMKVKSKVVFSFSKWKKLLSKRDNMQFIVSYGLRKYFHILSTPFYSTVIVTRELLIYNDYGSHFFERLLNAMHYNTVLDFDDDIEVTKNSAEQSKSLYAKLLLYKKNKFSQGVRYYDKFIVGSSYLKNRLKSFYPNLQESQVVVIPTCVDYTSQPAKKYSNKRPITFGWVGSNQNLKYLDIVLPTLNKLTDKYEIELLIISGREYEQKDNKVKIRNVRWDIDKETENIQKIDIGLMPLYDDEITKGKCGFKLIQYMGCGIVSIASGITINNEIVTDGVDGFLVHSNKDSEWLSVMEKVLSLEEQFEEIGLLARKKIDAKYSYKSHKQNYLAFVSQDYG